jgi:recombination protein RecA
MALMARFWSNHLPEIVPHLAKNNSSLLMVSQLRNTLAMYGPSKSSMGGNALKYYNSIKVELSKKEVIKDKGREVGCKVQLKNTKTKVGTPFVTKLISIYFPKFPGDTGGIDTLSDIVDTALDEKVIQQSGSMYTWHGFPEAKDTERKIRGKEAIYEFFKQNIELVELLKQDLINNINTNNNGTDISEEISSEEDDDQEEAA